MAEIGMSTNGGSEHIYTPRELNREVRLHIEMGFPRTLLEGEISNLSRPASGHLYFSLKDDKAQVRCALFRSSAARLPMRPENGMQVLARGRISLYEPRGDFQMIVDSLQEAGEGLLRQQFEQLKKKLDEEGLFDSAHKQELPPYPLRIGVVTSPSGAAVRDILQVLERRWPLARVRLYPVAVQGIEAVGEIQAALRAANAHDWAQLIILGRGGGSLEDMMAFNDEAVARAVFASTIPVISAVGHETDFSICDFTADLRAPTPSAAGELATPDQGRLKDAFERLHRQLQRRISDRLQRDGQRLDHQSHRLQQQHPRNRLLEQSRRLTAALNLLSRSAAHQLGEQHLKLANLVKRLQVHHPGHKLPELTRRVESHRQSINRLLASALRTRRQNLRDLARTLNAVSPLETIGRGYAVVTSATTGEVVGGIERISAGENVTAQLTDGRLYCTVDRTSEERLEEEE
jgi:exodeoxyribonuclease VII large subunit